jgi:hypothetical protein
MHVEAYVTYVTYVTNVIHVTYVTYVTYVKAYKVITIPAGKPSFVQTAAALKSRWRCTTFCVNRSRFFMEEGVLPLP